MTTGKRRRGIFYPQISEIFWKEGRTADGHGFARIISTARIRSRAFSAQCVLCG